MSPDSYAFCGLPRTMKRPPFVPDNFTLALVAVVMLASIAPAQGVVARFFDGLTAFAIGLLFFLHGAKLSRDADYYDLATLLRQLGLLPAGL